MMNKETQPKRKARPKKIQQPSLSTDKTVSLPLTSQPGSAEEAEGGQEKRKKITKAEVGNCPLFSQPDVGPSSTELTTAQVGETSYPPTCRVFSLHNSQPSIAAAN